MSLERGRKVIGISGSLIWSKTLMELIFNPCGEFRGSLEGPVSQIHTPHHHVGAPVTFSDLLRTVQMIKREWGAESNGKLRHLSICSKTAAWVFEFAVEDLPLGRTATLIPEFAVKVCPCAEYHQPSAVFCPRAGPSQQAQEPRLQFWWRQVYHRKLRNQGCSFTRDE